MRDHQKCARAKFKDLYHSVRHAGIPIPLARVAADVDRSLWGVHIGLYDLCAAWDEAAAADLRTESARELHYVDDYEPARQILELVLAVVPSSQRRCWQLRRDVDYRTGRIAMDCAREVVLSAH